MAHDKSAPLALNKEPKRVEILKPSGAGTYKRGQFGYVIAVNMTGGMHFTDRSEAAGWTSKPGEPAFLVSKTKHGRGGAVWFSAQGIRFTGKQK